MGVSESANFAELASQAGTLFTPAAPVSERELFAGRTSQIRQVIDAINQPGQHAVLYGERGVGKTSLGSVIKRFLDAHPQVIAPRINCLSEDNYTALWRRMFDQIVLAAEEPRAGLRGGIKSTIASLAAEMPEPLDLSHVIRSLTKLAQRGIVITIFDEFDTIKSQQTRRAMAETIKAFSDFNVDSTILIVGVADNVSGLISEHLSIERAVTQVKVPRMSDRELREVVLGRLQKLALDIDDDALSRICELSKGLPHYVHLLGLHATRAALDEQKIRIVWDHVYQAIEVAIEQTQHSRVEAYNRATYSAKTYNLFKQVLLACAIAEADELGWFSAVSVRAPLNSIVRGKQYDVPTYARHLKEFSSERRGRVLETEGSYRQRRYRFENPLMQPYILLRGISNNMISPDGLRSLNRGVQLNPRGRVSASMNAPRSNA